jgi:hypothetical protein
MSTARRLVRLSALGAVVLTASFAALAGRTTPPKRKTPPIATTAGEHRTRLLHSYMDTIKEDGRDVERRVDVVFDYTEGIAHHLIYGLDGALISDVAITANQPQPSSEEIAEAQAVLMADPELSGIVQRTGAVFEGGFVLEEAAGACGPRTRCLQILLLSSDRYGLVRRVVVDLTKQGIAYSNYTPPSSP